MSFLSKILSTLASAAESATTYDDAKPPQISEFEKIVNDAERRWTLTYVHDYMEPPGSDDLERAHEDIKEGRFDPPALFQTAQEVSLRYDENPATAIARAG